MDPFGDGEEVRPVASDVEEEQEERDPAAEFLAQQRNQMAGLEDDDYDKINANEDDTFGAFGDTTNNTTTAVAYGFDTEVQGLTDDNNAFQPNYSLNGSNEDMTETQANGFSSNYSVPKIRPATPEKIRKWREDQADRLEKKDAAEEKMKQELRDQARKELEDWYRQESDNMKKAKKNNRDAEEEFVQRRDSVTPGEEWERISRMCDFNPKNAKGTKDVSRLRSIILQLKQTPTSA